jgi:hypothetical protein
MIFDQLDPSAHAPWTSTTLKPFADIIALLRRDLMVTFLKTIYRLLMRGVTCQDILERLFLMELYGPPTWNRCSHNRSL